jgi:DNA-binding NarL/FixJ family response regulator
MPARPASLLTTIARLPHRFGDAPLARVIVVWALVLAAAAFLLQWLQYQYLVRVFSRDVYIAIIGTAFAAGGVWAGWKLSARPAPQPFARNDAAVASLGLTGQEMKVLDALGAGRSNKEIAKVLGLSPNTVKTHTASLYAKLGVTSRSLAVNRARELHILP